MVSEIKKYPKCLLLIDVFTPWPLSSLSFMWVYQLMTMGNFGKYYLHEK